MLRNVPLARGLYALELEDEVPPELYAAVEEEVLIWAEDRTIWGNAPRWVSRGGIPCSTETGGSPAEHGRSPSTDEPWS